VLLTAAIDAFSGAIRATGGCAVIITARAANIYCRGAVLRDVVVLLAFSTTHRLLLILTNADAFVCHAETIAQDIIGYMDVGDVD
jgi:hypothetical protein